MSPNPEGKPHASKAACPQFSFERAVRGRSPPHRNEDIAKHVYLEFIRAAEHLMNGVTAGAMNSDFHKWMTGLPKEQIKQQTGFGKILRSGYNLMRGRVLWKRSSSKTALLSCIPLPLVQMTAPSSFCFTVFRNFGTAGANRSSR